MKPPVKEKAAVESSVGDFRLEEFLPYRLALTSNDLARLFAKRYADSFNITLPEWRVLTAVGRYGTLSPSMVGDKTSMDKVKVSRAAGALSARGLVKQSPDPHDGRSKSLKLTRKGTNAYRGIIPLALETEALVAAGVTQAEWETLRRVLDKLHAHVQIVGEQAA